MSIVETREDIEVNNLDGCFLKAACALGGSAILITKLKNQSRQYRHL
ncbi:protein of unknown function,might belong to Demethyldecarbamoylnovobiocin O-methyltransferase [Shewanella benthica]|uniref:Uncharacterized protein n=1 Tax=Shewanella benthica TaxID=43661 RepID=A0A330M2M3_9GAMM|nr:protein of unknown function,might belong to Demethyldecarbamoylnovobiocin O-methyltransferase [Shewanella benthica]